MSMKVKFLRSATVIVDTGGPRVLMDPWLMDGAYYGSWALYPPIAEEEWVKDANDVDFIYVSHIHPDHAERGTLTRLRKNIPVLIHKYASPFLKRYLESFGFEVRELAHRELVSLGKGVSICIMAADDCDPAVCGRFFSCAMSSDKGSAQIDSMCVLTDGQQTIVNANDCPYDLAKGMLKRIKDSFAPIDLLMGSYGGAGPYPQCFANMTSEEKATEAFAKKREILNMLMMFAAALQPTAVFPFAGQYDLQGRLWPLNAFRNTAGIDEAYEYLERCGVPMVKIPPGGTYDLSTRKVDRPYVPVDLEAKGAYIRDVLSTRSYDYDADDTPKTDELLRMCGEANKRLESKRIELGIKSNSGVWIPLPEGQHYYVSFSGSLSGKDGPAVVDQYPHTVSMKVDPRLLHRILSGPKHAHWNNAEVGSHIEFYRTPNVFDRGVNFAMNWFHC
jgi:UDP-MurNAc hydroxylase